VRNGDLERAAQGRHVMEANECKCGSEYCGHLSGSCGKNVSVVIRVVVESGPDAFPQSKATGICEVCYANAKELVPWIFSL
jgi:hypothetical protein